VLVLVPQVPQVLVSQVLVPQVPQVLVLLKTREDY